MVAGTRAGSTALRAPIRRRLAGPARGIGRRFVLVAVLVGLAVGSPLAPPARAVTYLYLTISFGGNGSGAWQSQDGQIDCRMVNGYVDPREPCSGQYAVGPSGSVTVYYSITPATGSCVIIVDCPANGGAVVGASTTFSNDLTKSALINLIKYPLSVSKTGAGTGNIGSTPSGINCGSTCTASFNYGASVTLTAVADQGAYFAGWTGACAGQAQACSVTMSNSSKSTNAVFGFGVAPTPSTVATPVATPTATPATTPAATPKATPKATTKPAGTPTPGASRGPVPSVEWETPGPGSTAAGETPSAASPEAATPTTEPIASVPPVAPVAAGSDLTPIALAILGAGLLIAIGIGLAAYALRRRSVT